MPYIIRNDQNLISVISHITEPFEVNVYSFSYDWDIPSFATLYVPVGTKSLYESFSGWTVFANIVEGEPVTSIGKAVNSKFTEEGWYSLQGQKVDQPKRGIYIRNGQKMIFP